MAPTARHAMAPPPERPRSVQLDELTEPINVGQAFKAASWGQVKRGAKGKIGRKGEKACSQLTRKHPCIKHLHACEQIHCWQWLPDKRLSKLWHELAPEQRERVIQTHERTMPSQRFCAELCRHIDGVKCYASETAKEKMASLIWRDSSNSEIFKNMFRAAVEENMSMIIDMEVMAAVDSVLQDYCAELPINSEWRHWRNKILIRGLMLSVFVFWLVGSRFTWLLASASVLTILIYVWFTSPPCDPRTFEVGSERWAQYREHEHVRLMFISAMMCVFEVRLLRIYEARRKQARPRRHPPLAPRQQPRRQGEFTDGPLRQEAMPVVKKLGSRRILRERKRQGGESQDGLGHADEDEDEEDEEDEEEPEAQEEASPAPCRQEEEEVLRESQDERRHLELSTAEPSDDGSGDEFNENYLNEDDSEGDEIDAEFARRVREHFQSRAQAASKTAQSQTSRGNQVLKSLCEKLKTKLEQHKVD